MRLTIIGCSGSMSGKYSAASGYLLQADGYDAEGNLRTYSVTLDFGPGTMGQLLRYLDPQDLDAMFFSHLHADHCADIVGMYVYRRWLPTGQLPQISVYSPDDGLKRTRQLGGDPDDETYGGTFDFVQIAPGADVAVGPMSFEFFEAEHPVPAVGIRVTGPSEAHPDEYVTFGFTGDTDLCDTQVDMARGLDLLLSEAAFVEGRDSVRGIHMTGNRAGELAQRAGAKKMLLTHLQPWNDPEEVRRAAESTFDGPVRVVEAGDTYTI